ncbi:MAG: transcription elongation factor GreB [Gammaproteobacteria bacterium]
MGRWRPPTPGSSPYITAAGYRALEAELHRLGARRADTVRHLAAAAAEGDRSENAEYLYRKKELREIDRRLGYLQRRMPTLTVVDRPPPTRDRVFFGAVVELEDADGRASCHRIVGADELDRAGHFISVDSPLARALLKRMLDDEVTVRTARGEHRYHIVGIDYPADET